jgi:tRNA-dihydrouridine synthase 3
MSVTTLYPAGTAPIKAEFLLSTLKNLQPQVDDASAEEGTNHAAQKRRQVDDIKDDGTTKKPKLSGSERRKLAKEEKKAQRGSNKGKRWAKVRDEVDLCWRFAGSGKCDFGPECVSFAETSCRLVPFITLLTRQSQDAASRMTFLPISRQNPGIYSSRLNPC